MHVCIPISTLKSPYAKESGKILFVESGINPELWDPQYSSRKPESYYRDWNPESKFRCHRLKSSTWNPESSAWNPESKTVLDFLTWSDSRLIWPSYRVFSLTWPGYMQIYCNKIKRLHKKTVQLPGDWFGTPTWPSFHCFGTPIWPP